MKKLVVVFQIYSMSDGIAKKAVCEGGKTYTVTPMEREFPEGTTEAEADRIILDEFGRRPPHDPYKSIHTGHKFAEIAYHSYR